MSLSDKTSGRLSRLIEIGNVVLSTQYKTPMGTTNVNSGDFTGWRTRSHTALQAIFGEEATYPQSFAKATTQNNLSNAQRGVAILDAAKADVDEGYLTKTVNLISAEVFSDFLDMADHLLAAGYKDAAASLTGAVLENGLRRIASNHDIKVTSTDDLSSLRLKCAQAGIYNKLVLQQLVAWTTLRNYADHGDFGQYSAAEVVAMVGGVRDFLAARLT